MQSMTGYGTGRVPLGDGHFVLELRAVNHRFLDVRVRLPSRIQSRAHAVERVLRKRLQRGRVDVSGRLEGQSLPQATLDVERARVVYAELAALRDALNPNEPVPLSVLSSVPDLFVTNDVIDEQVLDDALADASEAACDAVEAMRANEGESLAGEMAGRLTEVSEHVERLREAAPRLVEDRRTRMHDRLSALLRDVDVQPEPTRLEQEIAILADRSDITEELARLVSHEAQMRELIANSGPIGKRMDFLLQEMAREANTIGSKAQDASITGDVIALKATIEQMREQAQNVL